MENRLDKDQLKWRVKGFVGLLRCGPASCKAACSMVYRFSALGRSGIRVTRIRAPYCHRLKGSEVIIHCKR